MLCLFYSLNSTTDGSAWRFHAGNEKPEALRWVLDCSTHVPEVKGMVRHFEGTPRFAKRGTGFWDRSCAD